MTTINIKDLSKEQLEDLRAQLKEHDNKGKVFKPKHMQDYYYFDSCGVYNTIFNSNFDEGNFKLGNCYKTESEANEAYNKQLALTRIKHYIAENCEAFVLEWGNQKQDKVYLVYDHSDKEFSYYSCCFLDSNSNFYFASREDAQKVIDNCEADLKIVWGIKQ